MKQMKILNNVVVGDVLYTFINDSVVAIKVLGYVCTITGNHYAKPTNYYVKCVRADTMQEDMLSINNGFAWTIESCTQKVFIKTHMQQFDILHLALGKYTIKESDFGIERYRVCCYFYKNNKVEERSCPLDDVVGMVVHYNESCATNLYIDFDAFGAYAYPYGDNLTYYTTYADCRKAHPVKVFTF